MKIYNEVVIDMNPESSTYKKHLSEDSFEYNGEIAKAGGKFAKGQDKHNPFDWTANQPGSVVPSTTPGISDMQGLPSWAANKPVSGISAGYKNTPIPKSQRDLWQGGRSGWDRLWGGQAKDAFSEYGAFGGSPNSPFDLAPMFGDIVEGLGQFLSGTNYAATGNWLERYKYGGGNATGAGPEKPWASGFYKPFYEQSVKKPLAELVGGNVGAEKGVAGMDQSRFMKAEDVLTPEQMQTGLAQVDTGPMSMSQEIYGGPIIEKSLEQDLSYIGGEMSRAELERDIEIAGFEEQRTDVQEAKEAELADISHQRKISTSPTAVLPGYEVASSAQAQSGMAYSAPAEQVGTQAKLESRAGLEDLKGQEQDTLKKYDENIEAIEGSELEAEIAYKGKQAGFQEQLGGVFAESADLAQEAVNEGLNILEGWKSYGETSGGGAKFAGIPNRAYASSIGQEGPGFYGENQGFMKSQGEDYIGMLGGLGGEAQDFARAMEMAAANTASDLGSI